MIIRVINEDIKVDHHLIVDGRFVSATVCSDGNIDILIIRDKK